MARDYNVTSTRVDKPAEHPAKAIMAKRWEERRAEARARRMAEKLDLGNSGLITLEALADVAAISSRPALASTAPAAHSSAPAPDAWSTTDAESSTPSLASLAAELPAPADSSSPSLADLAAATPAPAAVELPMPVADSSKTAPAIAADAQADQQPSAAAAPTWLRDSRKALLIVALVSNSLLFALLYFGGFLGSLIGQR